MPITFSCKKNALKADLAGHPGKGKPLPNHPGGTPRTRPYKGTGRALTADEINEHKRVIAWIDDQMARGHKRGVDAFLPPPQDWVVPDVLDEEEKEEEESSSDSSSESGSTSDSSSESEKPAEEAMPSAECKSDLPTDLPTEESEKPADEAIPSAECKSDLPTDLPTDESEKPAEEAIPSAECKSDLPTSLPTEESEKPAEEAMPSAECQSDLPTEACLIIHMVCAREQSYRVYYEDAGINKYILDKSKSLLKLHRSLIRIQKMYLKEAGDDPTKFKEKDLLLSFWSQMLDMALRLSRGFHFFWFPNLRSSYLNSPERMLVGPDTPQDRQLEIDFLMLDYQMRNVPKALSSQLGLQHDSHKVALSDVILYLRYYNKQLEQMKSALEQHPGHHALTPPAPYDEDIDTKDWLGRAVKAQSEILWSSFPVIDPFQKPITHNQRFRARLFLDKKVLDRKFCKV